jgi:hypothetical protein
MFSVSVSNRIGINGPRIPSVSKDKNNFGIIPSLRVCLPDPSHHHEPVSKRIFVLKGQFFITAGERSVARGNE